VDVPDAHRAFARRAWRAAYDGLRNTSEPDVDDLERLAIAAHMIGRDSESTAAWDRAYAASVAAGDPSRAVRCAFWLGFGLALRGETAHAMGWMSRAERVARSAGPDCATGGYLLMPVFLETVDRGDAVRAGELAEEILRCARQCSDPDLLALGTLAAGQAAIAGGQVHRGLRLLDEVMVGVAAGEVSPIPTGIIYCAVIEACVDCFDLRRAAEWTEALDEWCSAEPELVPYRGQCLVHRSQILQAHGDWALATVEARRAIERLAAHPALGLARYQLGELHRVRGELAAAAHAYAAAAESGRDPSPGLALLRLAEGNVEAARASVTRMLADHLAKPDRPTVLSAAAEIHLAAGDLDGAEAASAALTDIAEAVDVPTLRAAADLASGRVALARGEAAIALATLRRAAAAWRTLTMPYDEARTRVAVAAACRALGDDAAADAEIDAARAAFERLGAAHDLGRTAPPRPEAGGSHPAGLTDREVEVLGLVATGRTNHEIAGTLSISVHTVARHLQNIFTKLGVSSRAAATAYAYEHGIVG
jgi:ATP/maltotriose-dependent transcriptional regulator MalT